MEEYKFGDTPLNYLEHHGTKGMKWGVRRFQNKDGSLTAAGRARQRLQEASDRRKARKEEEARAKADKALRKKPISKLTEDEIRARISRLELEKKLVDLEKNTKERAEASSRVKTLMSTIGKEVVKPAVINAARNTLQNYLNGVGGNLVKNLLKDAAGGGNNNPSKKNRDNKSKNGSNKKPDDKQANDQNKKQNDKPNGNPVNKAQKPHSTEKTVDMDYTETGPQRSSSSSTSNSKATSVSDLYKSGYRMNSISDTLKNTNSVSVSDLYNSGYRMSSETGKSALDRLTSSGWTMRSLDDLEKYN